MDPYIGLLVQFRQQNAQRQRNLYNRIDPLLMYSDSVFRSNFRFSKDNFNRLLNLIQHQLVSPNQRALT